jgi:hypothetical protein
VIDKSLKPNKPKIYLCKPNRERVAFLKEAKETNLNLKYNDIHEITFELPYKISKNHKIVHNDHVDKIRGRYLLEVDNEFFIIDKYDKNAKTKKEVMTVHAFHLPYELRDKNIRGYNGVFNLTKAITDTLLAETNWELGYVDSAFDIKYRSFDVSEQTLLQFIFETAQMFKAVVYWDSKNKTVSFYQQQNLGADKGLYIDDRKYLKEIMETVDFDTVCTRLKLYGKDGLTVNGVSTTGQNHVENFSAFLYPYEEDENGNVISHSNYMSDGLCKAILAYNNFISTKEGEFQDLLSQKATKESELSTKETELQTLQDELDVILDSLDTANATGQDTTDILINKTNKENEIYAKQSEISSVEYDIELIENNITTLRNSLALENHFTPEQIVERNQYIIVRSFSNDSYYDDKELYDVGTEELLKLIFPPINIQIGIVNFLMVVKCQRDWDKLGIGDIITLRYPNFYINIKAKIHEININYESNDVKVTISDYKRLLTDEEYMQEIIYKNISTSTQVDMNKMWWESAKTTDSLVGQLLNNIWDANAREIVAGTNEEVTIGKRGLTIKDPDDPMNYLIAKHGIISITNDQGNSWKNALTKRGLVGERVYGQIIAGEDLTITTTNGSFLVNETGVSINGLALTITNGGIQDSQISSAGNWNNLINEYNNFVNTIYAQDIDNLQFQIDGNITSWFYDGEPTLANNPAVNWTTNDDKDVHLGDLYYDNLTGYAYRFRLNNTVYEWFRITDTDVTKALADAAKAQDTADSKRRGFRTTPIPPYDIGDIWSEGVDGDLKVCVVARASGSYTPTDWELATKYTDDTVANQALDIANNSVQKNTLYNGVKIDATDGLVVTRSDNKSKTIVNATNGIKIQSGDGIGGWIDKLYADTNGDLVVQDLKANNIIINQGVLKDSLGNTLIDLSNKTINFDGFDTKLGQITSDNIDVSTLYVGTDGIRLDSSAEISWDQIPDIPSDLAYQGDIPTSVEITQIAADYVQTPQLETNIGKVYDTLWVGSESTKGELKLYAYGASTARIYGWPWAGVGGTQIVYEANSHVFEGDVDFSYANVQGMNIVAKFG